MDRRIGYCQNICWTKIQEAILKAVAAKYQQQYRLATPKESKGIDGVIGKTSVSIKHL